MKATAVKCLLRLIKPEVMRKATMPYTNPLAPIWTVLSWPSNQIPNPLMSQMPIKMRQLFSLKKWKMKEAETKKGIVFVKRGG